MYTLIRSNKIRSLLWQEGLPLGVAFLIAELFFKWRSFALECAGFLATWTVLSWLLGTAVGRLTGKQRPDQVSQPLS